MRTSPRCVVFLNLTKDTNTATTKLQTDRSPVRRDPRSRAPRPFPHRLSPHHTLKNRRRLSAGRGDTHPCPAGVLLVYALVVTPSERAALGSAISMDIIDFSTLQGPQKAAFWRAVVTASTLSAMDQ